MVARNTTKIHPIQVAARYAGLSPGLIRTWENRYGILNPDRTKGGRRLYSEEDIEHLAIIRKVTQFGRRISEVAKLPIEKLMELNSRDETAKVRTTADKQDRLNTGKIVEYMDRCTTAIVKFDAHELQTLLQSAKEELDMVFLLEDLLTPLQHYVAQECREGELLNCHHSMCKEIIRSYLIALSARNLPATRSCVVCSMIRDPLLTAAKAAAIANHYGWNPIYLGKSIDCNEILDAVEKSMAHVIVISFDNSRENILIPNEMKRLVSSMPDYARLIVNAPEKSGYLSVLNTYHAMQVKNFSELRRGLQNLEDEESPERTTSAMRKHFLREPRHWTTRL